MGRLRLKSMYWAVKRLKIYKPFVRKPPENMTAHLCRYKKYGGVDWAYSRKRSPGISRIALLRLVLILELYPYAYRIRLGGYGDMLPQEKFLKIWCSEMASEAFFGPKNITCKSWHDNRICFTTTRMKIGVHWHWPFQVPPGTRQRSSAWKPVNILLLWILFRATPVKNVWPPRSQSACPQLSFTLGTQSSWVICVFLACKRRVGNIISVKTLVWWLPGLPDLLHLPCQGEMNAQKKQYR